MKLEGRVVLITGGARGIGAAVSRRFVAEGASIAIGDIRDELGESLAAELGGRAMFVHLDVSSEDEWAKAVRATVERFGKLDGLVQCAGIFGGWRPLKDYGLEDFMKVVEVNQVGVFLGMRAAIPALEQAGKGTIVNISSGAGLQAVPCAVAYVASKFAVTGMTKVAAIECRPLGIRVNSVHPGAVNTPLARGEGATPEGPGIAPEADRTIWGEPEQIANLVLYLTSDESSFSTGSEFIADGGVLAGVTFD